MERQSEEWSEFDMQAMVNTTPSADFREDLWETAERMIQRELTEIYLAHRAVVQQVFQERKEEARELTRYGIDKKAARQMTIADMREVLDYHSNVAQDKRRRALIEDGKRKFAILEYVTPRRSWKSLLPVRRRNGQQGQGPREH